MARRPPPSGIPLKESSPSAPRSTVSEPRTSSNSRTLVGKEEELETAVARVQAPRCTDLALYFSDIVPLAPLLEAEMG